MNAMKLILTKEKKSGFRSLDKLVEGNVNFYSNEGEGLYNDIRNGVQLAFIGDAARKSLEDWVLDNLTTDLKKLLMQPKYNFPKVGRGGHHVWVSNSKNERMFLIEFKN